MPLVADQLCEKRSIFLHFFEFPQYSIDTRHSANASNRIDSQHQINISMWHSCSRRPHHCPYQSIPMVSDSTIVLTSWYHWSVILPLSMPVDNIGQGSHHCPCQPIPLVSDPTIVYASQYHWSVNPSLSMPASTTGQWFHYCPCQLITLVRDSTIVLTSRYHWSVIPPLSMPVDNFGQGSHHCPY